MATIINNIRWADNTAELKRNLLEGIGTIDAMKTAVDRTVASLSGQGLFAAANRAAAAIQQMGGALGTAAGVTKLTSAELERNTALIDKASEKYKAMFGFVPQGWKDLSAEMEKAGEKTVQVSDVIGLIGSKFGISAESITKFLGPLGEISAVAAGAAVGLAGAAAEALHLAHVAAETGDHINDTALKMGIGAEQASELGAAVRIAGGDADTLANAVFMMSKRLEDTGATGEKARAAIRGVGIDAEAFLKLDADKQILAISDAFRELTPSAGQVNDIFGRQGREILPQLLKPLSELVEKSKALGLAWSNEDVKGATEAAMQSRQLSETWNKLSTDIGVFFIPVMEKADSFLQEIAGEFRNLKTAITDANNTFGVFYQLWKLVKDAPVAPEIAKGSLGGLAGFRATTAAGINDRAAHTPTATEAFDVATAAIKEQDEALKEGIKTRKEAQKAFEEMAQAMIDLQDETDRGFAGVLLSVNSRTIGNGLGTALGGIRTPSIAGLFGPTGLVGNPQGGAFPNAGPAQIGSKTFSTDTSSFAKDLFSGVPGAILAAIEGGGSKLQAAGSAIGNTIFGKDSSLTKTITGGITHLFGADGVLSKTISSAVPVIGALIGPAIAGIQKLFGKSEESAKVSPLRDAFFSAAGGLDVLNPKVQALTGNLTAVQDVFKAKTVDDYNAAIQRLNAVLDTGKQAQAELKAAVAEYGITIDELGPKFAQLQLNDTQGTLLEKWKLLNAAVTDHNALLNKTAGAFQGVVTGALKSGATISEELRQPIQELADMGLLVDENGEKLTDLSRLKFGTLDTEFQTLTKAINNLTRALGGAVDEAENLAQDRDATITVHAKYDTSGIANAPDAGGFDGGNTGEVIEGFAGGTKGWRNFGAGKMVQLHGIEAVVTPDQVGSLNAAGAAASDTGGAMPPVVINFNGTVLAATDWIEQNVVTPVLTSIERYHRPRFGRLVASVTP